MAKKLIETSLEKLIEKSSKLDNKQYRIQKNPKETELPHIRERTITAFAETKNTQLISRNKYYRASHVGDKVELDSDNHPYFAIFYGNKQFNLYDTIFLRNGGYASAMGQLHEQQLDKVYEYAKNEKHPILKKFKKEISKFLEKVPEIQDKLNRAHFKGNIRNTYEQLPQPDQWLYSALQSYHSGDKPKQISDLNQLAKQKIAQLWRTWYRSQINDERYHEKITKCQENNTKAFDEYVSSITERLEKNKFTKVLEIDGL